MEMEQYFLWAQKTTGRCILLLVLQFTSMLYAYKHKYTLDAGGTLGSIVIYSEEKIRSVYAVFQL